MNSNIRCIEIFDTIDGLSLQDSWIVTLDVLKCKLDGISNGLCELNSNIRCIEIATY